jgi:hypothetical protein
MQLGPHYLPPDRNKIIRPTLVATQPITSS